MSAVDWAYLAARQSSDYESGGHRTYFVPTLTAIAATATDVSNLATQAAASEAAASATYALSLGFTLSAYGVGLGSVLDIPRGVNLGTAAFLDWEQIVGVVSSTKDSTYQINPQDHLKLLMCTSGTRIWTAPLMADLPERWGCLVKNRSGNNLTLNRSGSDTFNGGLTTLAVASGQTIYRIIKTSSTTFEFG